MEATGVDLEVVMELINFSGFDFSLLNYAGYILQASPFEIRRFPGLTLYQSYVARCTDGDIEAVNFVPSSPFRLFLMK